MNQEQYLQDQAAIERRQRIAQMLMEQGTTPIDTTQMAGGYVVPVSPLAAVSKIAQQLSGAYIGKKASQKEAALKAQRLQELGSINFNSGDLPGELVKAGYPEEAIKIQMQKAQQQSPNRYQPTNMVVMGKDNQLHVRRFGSDPSAAVIEDSANVPNDMQYLNNGEQFVPVPKKVVSQNNDIPGNIPFNERLTQAFGAVESNNNPNAQSPTSTASGAYQFTEGTRSDAGLNGASPEQETAFMNELNKARLSRYQDPRLAILSHNIGLTGADQVASGKRAITPKMENYVKMVYDKLGMDSPLKMKLTPAQALENDPNQKAALAAAAAEAVLPAKAKEAKIEADISNQKAIDLKTKEQAMGGEKGAATVNDMMKYLYPSGTVERDANGRLKVPKDVPILGNSVSDRVAMMAHEYGIHNDKASNLLGARRLVGKLVLDANNGSLGSGVSNADVSFLKGLQGIADNAQDPQDIYNAIADNEDRFNRLMGKQSKEQPKTESTDGYSQSDLEHTAKIHGITVEEVKKRLGK
jgi:hypothetical protein